MSQVDRGQVAGGRVMFFGHDPRKRDFARLSFLIGGARMGSGGGRRAAEGAQARRGLSRAGAIRRLAGKPRDLVLGRRDPRRLQPGLLQGSRPVPPHRPRQAGRVSLGPESRRRPHLVGRGAPSKGGADGHNGHAPRHPTGRSARGTARRPPRAHRLHSPRLRAVQCAWRTRTTGFHATTSHTIAGSPGGVRFACRSSGKWESWAGRTSS